MCGEDRALAQTFIFVQGVFTGLYVTQYLSTAPE